MKEMHFRVCKHAYKRKFYACEILGTNLDAQKTCAGIEVKIMYTVLSFDYEYISILGRGNRHANKSTK